MATLLKDLDVDRVDAVDKPAHKSKFLILKAEDAKDLQDGVQKLADASESLVDAVAKKDAAAIRKAAAAVAELIGKDAETLTTLVDAPESEDAVTGTQPADIKGEPTEEGGIPAQVDAEIERTAPPQAVTGKQPKEIKGEPLQEGGIVRASEDPVAKADSCAMCGAPVGNDGKYSDAKPDAPAAKSDTTTEKAFGDKKAPPFTDAEDAKDKGDDEATEKKKTEKAAAPAAAFDPVAFADAITKGVAESTAKAVETALTKFAEAQAAKPAPVAKSSKQADDDTVVRKARTSFADIVFDQGLAKPRG